MYLCVARPTHHLTVPTVSYSMSRTNLLVRSLDIQIFMCQNVCLYMSVSLMPRPHEGVWHYEPESLGLWKYRSHSSQHCSCSSVPYSEIATINVWIFNFMVWPYSTSKQTYWHACALCSHTSPYGACLGAP